MSFLPGSWLAGTEDVRRGHTIFVDELDGGNGPPWRQQLGEPDEQVFSARRASFLCLRPPRSSAAAPKVATLLP